MTEQEYNEKVKIAEKNYKYSLNEIYKQYAFDLRKFKIGDIIKNNGTTIIIESFSSVSRDILVSPWRNPQFLSKKRWLSPLVAKPRQTSVYIISQQSIIPKIANPAALAKSIIV